MYVAVPIPPLRLFRLGGESRYDALGLFLHLLLHFGLSRKAFLSETLAGKAAPTRFTVRRCARPNTSLHPAGLVAIMPSGEPEEPGSIPPDAVVAAWLPGSEGQGVADVLFGDYKPTGKLSFTWPKAVGKGTAAPLFAYG